MDIIAVNITIPISDDQLLVGLSIVGAFIIREYIGAIIEVHSPQAASLG